MNPTRAPIRLLFLLIGGLGGGCGRDEDRIVLPDSYWSGERRLIGGLDAEIAFGFGSMKGAEGELGAPHRAMRLVLGTPAGEGGWVSAIAQGKLIRAEAGAQGLHIQCNVSPCAPGRSWLHESTSIFWDTEMARGRGFGSYYVWAIGGGRELRVAGFQLVGEDATLLLCFSPGSAPVRFETETGPLDVPFSPGEPMTEPLAASGTKFEPFAYGVTAITVPPGTCTSIPFPPEPPRVLQPREAP